MSNTVCIYCGANTGHSNEIVKAVNELCQYLATNGYDLVYGGGNSGLMGVVADIFLNHNRSVVGVRPTKLIKDEDKKDDLSQLIETTTMHERKSRMIDISDVFIALPGGVGTLDEIIDVYTNIKIGFVNKKCGILNTNNMYEGLDILLSSMVQHGFLTPEDKAKLRIETSPQKLIESLDL